MWVGDNIMKLNFVFFFLVFVFFVIVFVVEELCFIFEFEVGFVW